MTRPPAPGRAVGEIPPEVRAQLETAQRRHGAIETLDVDEGAWSDSPVAAAATSTLWTLRRAAGAVDPLFGLWVWDVAVDGDRQLGLEPARWEPRIPAAWAWGMTVDEALTRSSGILLEELGRPVDVERLDTWRRRRREAATLEAQVEELRGALDRMVGLLLRELTTLYRGRPLWVWLILALVAGACAAELGSIAWDVWRG